MSDNEEIDINADFDGEFENSLRDSSKTTYKCMRKEICKKYVLSNSVECSMRSSGAMTMSHIVLDTFNVCV